MASILSQALTRIADMQVSALAAMSPAVTADAKPFWPYEQEEFPYFTNRLGPYRAITEDGEEAHVAEDVAYDEYIILMRLVVAHLTQDYQGEVPADVYEMIPALLDYFSDNPLLTSAGASYTSPLDYVAPEGVLIQSSTPYGAFTNGSSPTAQLGIEFSLRLPLLRKVF